MRVVRTSECREALVQQFSPQPGAKKTRVSLSREARKQIEAPFFVCRTCIMGEKNVFGRLNTQFCRVVCGYISNNDTSTHVSHFFRAFLGTPFRLPGRYPAGLSYPCSFMKDRCSKYQGLSYDTAALSFWRVFHFLLVFFRTTLHIVGWQA